MRDLIDLRRESDQFHWLRTKANVVFETDQSLLIFEDASELFGTDVEVLVLE